MEIKIPSDLGKLFDLLRKKGIKSFKFEGIEIELLPELPPSNYKRKILTEQSDDTETEARYSDSDAMFWSSSPIDEPSAGAN
jgi:hypothetical protein